MFAEDFDIPAALAATSCPRSAHVGLDQIDNEQYKAASRADRHEPKAILCPTLYVQCPECQVVAEWPDCERP